MRRAVLGMLLVLAVVAVGFVVGVAAYARLGSSAVAIPEGAQVALLAVIAAGIGAIGVVVGSTMHMAAARYAADLAHEDATDARRSAREDALRDRQASRDAMLFERKVALMGDVLQGAERHIQEVRNQISRRQEVAERGGDPATIPTVGSSDAVGQAAASLYGFASQDTADAAWRVFQTVLTFDQFAYDVDRHRINDRVVGLDEDTREHAEAAHQRYLSEKTAYLNRMRIELGMPVLVTRSSIPARAAVDVPASTIAPQVDGDPR